MTQANKYKKLLTTGKYTDIMEILEKMGELTRCVNCSKKIWMKWHRELHRIHWCAPCYFKLTMDGASREVNQWLEKCERVIENEIGRAELALRERRQGDGTDPS